MSALTIRTGSLAASLSPGRVLPVDGISIRVVLRLNSSRRYLGGREALLQREEPRGDQDLGRERTRRSGHVEAGKEAYVQDRHGVVDGQCKAGPLGDSGGSYLRGAAGVARGGAAPAAGGGDRLLHERADPHPDVRERRDRLHVRAHALLLLPQRDGLRFLFEGSRSRRVGGGS